MAGYYSLSVQVTEVPKGGGYNLTATTLTPNTTFRAGEVRVIGDLERVVGTPGTQEIQLHLIGGQVTGLHQLHDLPVVWQSEGIQLGNDWSTLSIQMILNGSVNIGSLIVGASDGKEGATPPAAGLGKQRLSELSVRAQVLSDSGVDMASFVHKQKGNGC